VSKCDALNPGFAGRTGRSGFLFFSSRTGEGIPELLGEIERRLDENLLEKMVRLPFHHQKLLNSIHRTAHILEEKYEEKEIMLRILIDSANWLKIKNILGDTTDDQNQSTTN
jgi:50S ribosomal subunit-associated GTPase HflX